MKPMRVLFTNNTLDARAGSELWVRDVAIALLERGHHPVAYSNRLGEVAAELRESSVPVIDNLSSLSLTPDIIHGHHHLEAMTAFLHFPTTAGVLFCHGWAHWEEMPVQFPRIRRYLAMNQRTFNRLTCEHGIPEDRVEWMPNFVDLRHFPQRPPLPERPKRALVFSHYLTEDGYLPIIRDACERAQIALDGAGLSIGKVVARPGELLGHYDLVFASGRSALEAVASGAAVIVATVSGLGPMVTTGELESLRQWNFGAMTTVGRPFTVETVLAQIARYDARDATEASNRVRAAAGLDATADRLINLYRDVIAEQAQAVPSPEADSRAAAAYLAQISERVKASGHVSHLLNVERANHDALRYLHSVAQRELDQLRAKHE